MLRYGEGATLFSEALTFGRRPRAERRAAKASGTLLSIITREPTGWTLATYVYQALAAGQFPSESPFLVLHPALAVHAAEIAVLLV
jgi:hypothetical protein